MDTALNLMFSLQKYTKKIDLWKNLLIDVTLAVTLGIPWIFGYVMLGGVNEDLSYVFSYLFAVFNSLQGRKGFLKSE